MCITVNRASLSKTKILSLPLENGNHFIAYSNSVKNLSGKPNAMILPIPGETNPSLFHDTTKYKNFMEDIIEKCGLDKYYGILSKSLSRSLSFDQFELGMYTVGLASKFDGVRDFLNSLPEEKRPEVSDSLKNFFQEKYAGWSFAICVFDSDKTIDAQPMAFEYKPFVSELIFFPTMDGHDGEAPDMDALVKMDHTFIYEHTGLMEEDKYIFKHIHLKDEVPEFLQNRKFRSVSYNSKHINGDTFLSVEQMNSLNFDIEPEFKKVKPVPYITA